MLAMMAGGLWVIMDPAGTIGALGRWANQASLGTLGAVGGGHAGPCEPDAGRQHGRASSAARSTGRGATWSSATCGWCSDPRRWTPRLRAAGLRSPPPSCRLRSAVASAAPLQRARSRAAGRHRRWHRARSCCATRTPTASCSSRSRPTRRCATRSTIRLAVQRAVRRRAKTPCRGPTAAQAEFRTERRNVRWRFCGLRLIWVGVLGMLLLLGFIALRLLGAAIASLLYLLLAPAAVLAPALGDGGPSGLPGVGDAAARRGDLEAHVLVSARRACWWCSDPDGRSDGARLVDAVAADVGVLVGRVPSSATRCSAWRTAAPRSSVERTVACAARERRARRRRSAMLRRAGRVRPRRKLSNRAPPAWTHRHDRAERSRASGPRTGTEAQVARALEQRASRRGERRATAPAPERSCRRHVRSSRVCAAQRVKAPASGDTRRAARTGPSRAAHRSGDRALAAGAEPARRAAERRRTGAACDRARVHAQQQAEARERFLDAQAALPAARRLRGPRAGARRDYAALAGPRGIRTRGEYERLDPRAQRAARLEIDRELALRSELGDGRRARRRAADATPRCRREKRKVNEAVRQQRSSSAMRDGGHRHARIARGALGVSTPG